MLRANTLRSPDPTAMQANSAQICRGTRYLKYLAGRRRFQVLVALVTVWWVGLYMGSKDHVIFHITSFQDVLRDGAIHVRQGVQLPNLTVLSKPAVKKDNSNRPTTASVSKSSIKLPSTRAQICNFPEIDPFDPSLETHLRRKPPLNCSSGVPNVVYLQDDKIKIDPFKLKQALVRSNGSKAFGFCQYKVLHRKPNADTVITVNSTSEKFKSSIQLAQTDEHVRVECNDTRNQTISRSYFTIMRLDPEQEKVYNDSYKVHIDKHSPAETLSILLIGIDGFSKQHFARAMPKTRKFLMEELGALEMHKHNKLGYSTSPNVVPLLTGRTNEEFAEDTKWRFKIHGWMDQINEAFVWSDARRLGYRTALMLDQVSITAFHYARHGFNKKPVDHYLRPIVVDSVKDALMREPNKHCFGDEPEISKLYDYWMQLLRHYNSTKSKQVPFLAYSFLSRLTHDDCNMAFAGDELYLKLLKDLTATNALNNTVIVWFSDHGERFGGLRSTFTGEIETNTPYLFFAFPPWFEKKYPKVMRVFRANQNRLTSHFDTYATLQDLLYFKGVDGPKGKLGERSISLFREIPVHRTCEDAQIPAEYCVCFVSSHADVSPGLAKYMGTLVKNKVMSKLKDQKEKCTKLSLGSVESVIEEKSTEKENKSIIRNFRVVITTEPGEAQFNASVKFDESTNKAKVVSEIDRTNTYLGQSECIDNMELRKYCYCKKLLAVTA
ncbi:hypothetical protein RRG08_044989 [Elysia crispata]|uniref:Uncharacterized protein n=1 Tax=Elysia crispata TaxID=231223 RepID=A0AAE0Y541_9GAST|nr:hypothetical protein RRG08_044989 [Elysia crispata]